MLSAADRKRLVPVEMMLMISHQYPGKQLVKFKMMCTGIVAKCDA